MLYSLESKQNSGNTRSKNVLCVDSFNMDLSSDIAATAKFQ